MVAEAMRRLDFPVLELSVERDTPEHVGYVQALRTWDNHKSIVPLCDFFGVRSDSALWAADPLGCSNPLECPGRPHG